MATYKHLRSGTANKRPTTSIADGQLAINTNTASPGLFFKDSAGTGIVKVGPVHVGTTAPNSSPAVGGSTGNYLGEQWLDTSVSPAQMKVWNGSTWVGVVADELPVSKLQDGAARQLIQTDAAGTGVEWTSNVDVPGTLDVTSTATFDSIAQHPLGTAAAPTITFTGDTNTGVYSPGADQVAISTGGTGRLFVDASGNVTVDTNTFYVDATNNRVGIGTTSPADPLVISQDVGTGTGNLLRLNNSNFTFGTGLGSQIDFRVANETTVGSISFAMATSIFTGGSIAKIATRTGASSYFQLDVNGSERLRVDSSGRLLVGTSSSSRLVTQILQGNSTSATTQSVLFFARGSASPAINQALGVIEFGDSNHDAAASVAARRDTGTWTPGVSHPGRLELSTTADGASSPTERLRITNDGVQCYDQAAPVSYAAAATLVISDLKNGLVQYTGAAATLTLPTGTLTEGGFSGIYTNMTFEWSVINTGSGTCTIGNGTGHTVTGSATVAAGASGRFASRRTAANTFVSYRLS